LNSGSRELVCCLFLAALAACAPRIPYERETSSLPLPEAIYIKAAKTGATVYRIVPEESLVLIHVGRAGKMASLGHDHAVASKDVQGFIELAADPLASHADIVMPLKSLMVDEPQYRARLDLESEPSSDDIASTYSNMRRVLEAELFPWAKVELRFASANTVAPEVIAVITLHGMALETVVPVEMEIDENRLSVVGHLSFGQSDFGLTPFGSAGGLLRVADELQVEFELVAVRLKK